MDSTKERMNKAYIDGKLSSIFEPMVNAIFSTKPEDPVIPLCLTSSQVEFMIKFLKDQYGNRASSN